MSKNCRYGVLCEAVTRPRNGRTRKLTRPIQVGHVGSRISKIWISSLYGTPFSGCFSEKWKKWLILWGGKGVIFELTAAHVPDVLEQNPSGFEFYSPKSRFLSGRQRHSFKLIDPNIYAPFSKLEGLTVFSLWWVQKNCMQPVCYFLILSKIGRTCSKLGRFPGSSFIQIRINFAMWFEMPGEISSLRPSVAIWKGKRSFCFIETCTTHLFRTEKEKGVLNRTFGQEHLND